MPSAITETAACGCPVCDTAAKSEAAYFACAFGGTRGRAATAEAIADALGFCRRHGAHLLLRGDLTPGVAKVFHDVAHRIGPLVAEDFVRSDRFWESFFGANESCPACAYEQRATARHVGRLAREYSNSPEPATTPMLAGVCVAHLRRIADELNPELRMPFLARCLDTLVDAARSLDEKLRFTPVSNAADLDSSTAEWRRAFNLIVGNLTRLPVSHDGELGNDLHSHRTFADAITDSHVCAVCSEIERVRQRWIHDVPTAGKHGVDGWLLFPTCPEHISNISALGDTCLTGAVISNALHGAMAQVQHQIQVLVRAAKAREDLAAARIARWGKRRRRKSAGPKLFAPRSAKCPACERIDLAQAKAIGKLLELLCHEKCRHAFQHGYGLCMKHFAQAYLIAPRGVVRTALSADQQVRLTDAALKFSEMTHGNSTSGKGTLRELRYRLALHRICGFAGNGEASPHAHSP